VTLPCIDRFVDSGAFGGEPVGPRSSGVVGPENPSEIMYRARGYQHPTLHLRELSPYGIFASFADQFEQIWQTTTAYPPEPAS